MAISDYFDPMPRVSGEFPRPAARWGAIALTLVAVLLAAACQPLKAAVIFSEDFNYPDGVLQEVSAEKWTGHSGATNEVDVLGSAVSLNQTESQDVSAELPGQPFATPSTTALYAKFTVKFSELPASAGAYFAHFKDGGIGFRGRVWALTQDAAPGALRLGIGSATGSAINAVLPVDLQLETPYTIVLRFTLADAVGTLWVNPASEGDPSISSEAAPPIAVKSFALRQAAGIGLLTVDDVMVATSFEELTGGVVEPVAPTILTQPQSLTIAEGGTGTFGVVAAGTPPLEYQWQFNGADLSGETSSTLTLANVSAEKEGSYQVLVSNAQGSVLSDSAFLILGPPDAGGEILPPTIRFTNLLDQVVLPGDALRSTSLLDYALRPGEMISIKATASTSEGAPLTFFTTVDNASSNAAWSVEDQLKTNRSAAFTYTAAAADAGKLLRFSLTVSNSVGMKAVEWKLYVPTEIEQRIVINEYLANPSTNPAAAHFNPLRRATPSTRPTNEDEFVELVNIGDQVLGLDGWMLSDATSVRHRFAATDQLPPGQALVVFGGQESGSAPSLPRNVASVAANRSTSLGLNNTGDSIVLRNAQSNIVARVVYTSSGVTTNSTITRAPDLEGKFDKHATVSDLAASPGVRSDGTLFALPPPTGPVPIKLVPSLSGLAFVLRWTADTNETYTVLRAVNGNGPFETAAAGLSFSTRQGEFRDNEAGSVPARFYRVRSP